MRSRVARLAGNSDLGVEVAVADSGWRRRWRFWAAFDQRVEAEGECRHAQPYWP